MKAGYPQQPPGPQPQDDEDASVLPPDFKMP